MTAASLTKKELVVAIAEKAAASGHELSQNAVSEVLDALADVIIQSVNEDKAVKLPRLGTFQKAERGATTARNPRTGETVEVPARSVAKFKLAKEFKDTLNA